MGSKLTDSLKACLLNLEEHHHRNDGWRPSSAATPSLCFLYRKDGEVVWSELNLEPSLWSMTKTIGGFLRASSRLLETKGDLAYLLMPDNFVGVAVVCEGWSLSQREDKDFEKIAEARRIHLSPNRRESRMVVGTLLAGQTVFSVIRWRRHDKIQEFPGEDGTWLGGGVPEGLRYFADTMLAISSKGARNDKLIARLIKQAETDPTMKSLLEGVVTRQQARQKAEKKGRLL